MTGIPQEFASSADSPHQTTVGPSFDRPPLRSDRSVDRTAPPLPAEIDFLARHGFSPEALLNAIGAAPRGVRPIDSLLGDGIVEEEGYYRALAQHLGCEYYSGDPPFAAD